MRHPSLVLAVALCLGSMPAAGQTLRAPPRAGSGVHAVPTIPSTLWGAPAAPSISPSQVLSLPHPLGAPGTPDLAILETPAIAVQGAPAPLPVPTPAVPASLPAELQGSLPAAAPESLTGGTPERAPLPTLKAVSDAAPSSKDPAEREEQSGKFWRKALGEAQAAPDDGADALPGNATAGSVSESAPAGAGEDLAQAWNRLAAKRSSTENRARWEAALASARKTTRSEVKRLLAMRASGPKVHAELATSDTKTITEYRGVPGRIEVLPEDGRVYRHWVRSPADLESILGSGLLRAGQVSYVEFTGSRHAFIKDIYLDLHGPFFTARENKASEPRVMNEDVEHYVDFRLPPGVAALSLDGDDVMMIPAERGTFVPVEIVGSSLAP